MSFLKNLVVASEKDFTLTYKWSENDEFVTAAITEKNGKTESAEVEIKLKEFHKWVLQPLMNLIDAQNAVKNIAINDSQISAQKRPTCIGRK